MKQETQTLKASQEGESALNERVMQLTRQDTANQSRIRTLEDQNRNMRTEYETIQEKLVIHKNEQ